MPAIAYSMGISFYPNVEPEKQLLQALRTTQTLLVLDNFEHLLLRGGVDVVNGILQAAPDVKILVTYANRSFCNERRFFMYMEWTTLFRRRSPMQLNTAPFNCFFRLHAGCSRNSPRPLKR